MTLAELAPYILIGIILVSNIALWVSMGSSKSRARMDIWGKAGLSLQKPLEKEQKKLSELNDRVRSLQSSNQKPDDTNKTETDQ